MSISCKLNPKVFEYIFDPIVHHLSVVQASNNGLSEVGVSWYLKITKCMEPSNGELFAKSGLSIQGIKMKKGYMGHRVVTPVLSSIFEKLTASVTEGRSKAERWVILRSDGIGMLYIL